MKHFLFSLSCQTIALDLFVLKRPFFLGGGGATQSPTHNQLPKRSEKEGKKKK